MAEASKKLAPSHPPYLEMIAEALQSLKERSGSSIPAITKWIEAHYGKELVERDESWKKRLNYMLKTYTQQGKLVRVRASYKLSTELKGDLKKAQAKEPQAPKAAAAAKKAEAKPKAKKEATETKPKRAPAKPKTPAKPKREAAKPKAAAAKPRKAAAQPKKAAAKPHRAAPKAKAKPAAAKKATPAAATKKAAPAKGTKRAAPATKTTARKAAKK